MMINVMCHRFASYSGKFTLASPWIIVAVVLATPASVAIHANQVTQPTHLMLDLNWTAFDDAHTLHPCDELLLALWC